MSPSKRAATDTVEPTTPTKKGKVDDRSEARVNFDKAKAKVSMAKQRARKALLKDADYVAASDAEKGAKEQAADLAVEGKYWSDGSHPHVIATKAGHPEWLTKGGGGRVSATPSKIKEYCSHCTHCKKGKTNGVKNEDEDDVAA